MLAVSSRIGAGSRTSTTSIAKCARWLTEVAAAGA
jgi:hypothetical protein